MNTYRLVFILIFLLGFAGGVSAEDVAVPNTFTSGSKARAAEVNANFAELATAINALKAEVEGLKTENADLKAIVLALDDNSMLDLADYVEVYHDSASMPSGTATQGPLIRFTGANVQIVSGAGTTDAPVNGVGNLIVGYDEARTQQNKECSDGRFDNITLCYKSNNAWKSVHKSGSHNLIIGANHNYSRHGGLVAGFQNSITGVGASVLGGTGNTAGFENSTVTGSSDMKTTAANNSQPDYWLDSAEARGIASQALNTANSAQHDALTGLQMSKQNREMSKQNREELNRMYEELTRP